MPRYYCRVIKAINKTTSRFVIWPSNKMRSEIKSRILQDYGIPDCVGIVDGTHIILQNKPALCGSAYYNRKCSYSINVQIISDDTRRILFYDVRYFVISHQLIITLTKQSDDLGWLPWELSRLECIREQSVRKGATSFPFRQ